MSGHGGTATKKMLQNIKEIVGGNFSDEEIYVTLKECNMDPSETVHRLLNQDTFHKVKSKREKKKEIKDNVESRPRGVNNGSNRGGKGFSDRAVRVGSAQLSFGGNYIKPIPKKENGLNNSSSSSVLGAGARVTSGPKSSIPLSDSVLIENTGCLAATADSMPSQDSAGILNAWTGMPGQRTLADVVKMGKPPGKISGASVAHAKSNASHNANASISWNANAKCSSSTILSTESHHEKPIYDTLDVIYEPGVSVGQHVSHDEWPIIDQSNATNSPSLLETCDPLGAYSDQSTSSNLHADVVTLHHNSRSDETQVVQGNADGDVLEEDSSRSLTACDRHVHVGSGEESGLDRGEIKDMNSYHSHTHNFERHEANVVDVDVSSAAATLQRLCLDQEQGISVTQAEEKPAVIIPSHLQVTNADCSHLSFGSFGSGISAAFSGSFASKTLQSDLEMQSDTADATPNDDSDARNSDYYITEQLRPASSENADCRSSTIVESYEMPSSSQPDISQSDLTDSIDGNQCRFQSSMPDCTFSNNIQSSAVSFASVHGNSQVENPAPFSNVMQAYTSSLPNNLLALTIPAREFDLPYSSLLATQSMPTKFGTAMSSISGPTVSMPEAVKPGALSAAQPTQQNLTTSSIPAGPTLQQHLHVHPYSQTLPLGHFANMIGYPFLPQSYTYMPSTAFPQAYASNSAYHQPPAAINAAGLKYTLPQYKTSIAMSSLPQSAAVPSGLGGFGSLASIPGSFALNQSMGAASSSIGYDDILSTQYKEGSHYTPQQNERSVMWLHGGGARTMSALPASTYYNMQGRNLLGELRQSQQPSHYGSVGFPNLYHSQASGVSQEHQLNAGDGRLDGSQVAVAQTAQQIWQHY